MIKIAGHTMGTPEYTLDEAITLFAALGFDGIEIIWDDSYHCALRKGASSEALSSAASSASMAATGTSSSLTSPAAAFSTGSVRAFLIRLEAVSDACAPLPSQ